MHTQNIHLNIKDLIKIGYTARSLDERMKEHYPTRGPNNIKRYKVLLLESSMRNDGSYFIDKDVHKILKKMVTKIKEVNGLIVKLMM